MADQSPIFVKTEAFMAWLFEHTGKYPRHERFRLAKRIDDALFNFHACLQQAASVGDARLHLKSADVQLNLLRTYLRIGVELKYTTPEQYQHAAQHTSEIGKLLGGWLKKA